MRSGWRQALRAHWPRTNPFIRRDPGDPWDAGEIVISEISGKWTEALAKWLPAAPTVLILDDPFGEYAREVIDCLDENSSRYWYSVRLVIIDQFVPPRLDLKLTPDPVRVASEGALWGAICEEGRLGELVIVSDGAGQFRVGVHAQCWVHAERLVHKLVPANEIQRRAVEVARRMIWWLYDLLRNYKLAASPERAELLRARFRHTLMRSLLRLEDRLLRVLDRPEIPLHTNASENDIRAFVTKRKISGGTASDNGRDARDVMLGLAKTCAKLKLRFFDYLGARLAIPGPSIPNLPDLVREAPN